MNEDTLIFFLPSMINPPDTKLRFGFPRTNLSIEERYNQTLEGIRTLKKHLGNRDYRLYLLEASILPKNYIRGLSDQVDRLFMYYSDDEVRRCTTGDCKSLGEVCTIRAFLRWFNAQYPNQKFKCMFKYGIRYPLKDEFTLERYFTDKITVHKMNPLPMSHPGIPTVYSTFYSIPCNKLQIFTEQINKCHDLIESGHFFDIENCLVFGIPEHCTILDEPIHMVRIDTLDKTLIDI
jgi:hypothetical protein